MSIQMGVFVEVSKLVGTGAIGNARQGWSVKLSEYGNFLFVTGFLDDNANGQIGAVWFYQKINGVWTQKQKIVPTGYSGPYVHFGYSIAVNPSMNTLIVGARADNSNRGALYVFEFDGTTWTQEAKLVGNDVTNFNEYLGSAVALSADANTAIVGGPSDDSQVGAAWIFVRDGNTWAQQGSKLVGTDYSGQSNQGDAVALSSDGNLAVVGAWGDSSNAGAIWVFLRSGISWNQVGTKITATGEIGAGQFGISLALSGDDQTLVVGGLQDNSGAGAAWIFKRNGNTFTQFGNKLVGVGATSNSVQGTSVAVNKLGTLVAIGAAGDSSYVGATFVYYFNGTNYKQLGNKIVATDAIGEARQGFSVSLDGSGSQLLFGWNDNGNAGATWIYVNTTITSSPSIAPTGAPTTQPSFLPTTWPSIGPTTQPSVGPSTQPSLGPTTQPSLEPTLFPSFTPSVKPTAIATSKPTSVFSSTSSGAFLSLVTVIPVLVFVWLALMYFFFRVYKKQVNKEGAEMKDWIQGNKGEIALHGKNFGDKRNDDNEDDGLEVAPMDNPLQTLPSLRKIDINV